MRFEVRRASGYERDKATLVEVNTLEEFLDYVEETGRIIIDSPDGEGKPWKLLVYDTWIE